jgi:GNAT superfamily N-acetyltransferase
MEQPLATNSKELLAKIREMYPDTRIYFSEDPNQIYLHNLEVPPEKRRQGIGRKIIELLQDYANYVKKPLVLEPAADRGYKKKLEDFYKNLGFVHNKGRNIDFTISRPLAKTMYYKPKVEFKKWLDS